MPERETRVGAEFADSNFVRSARITANDSQSLSVTDWSIDSLFVSTNLSLSLSL